jgi:hypothetical protein
MGSMQRLAFLTACLCSVVLPLQGIPQDRSADGKDEPQQSKPKAAPGPVGEPTAPASKNKDGQQPGRAKVEVRQVPAVATDNKNTLILKHRKKLTLTASSTWEGWPTDNAFDGVLETSWFTARDDAAAKGTKPWLQVTFPTDVTVGRVTILGNRDPAWLNGYTILAGSVELLDKNSKRLKYEENEGTGNFRDFDFAFTKPIAGVRAIRFTSQGDQGDQNPYGDIAIAEFQVE